MLAMEPKKEGWEGGDGLHVIHECTVWFGSTRREIDDGGDEKIPAGGNFERALIKMWFREFKEILKILYYTLFLPVTRKGYNIVSECKKTIVKI